MRTTVLYRIARWIVRVALTIYFRRIEITGASLVPESGPVILASNHPHSITDALVLSVATGRMLHYVAHSGLFQNRFKAWFLRRMGVIPVYRRTDVEQAADKNVAMFAACHDLMRCGGVVAIFPEGTSQDERRVQRLKTGAARIALESEAENNWSLGIQVIPIGLNFESRNRFRTRVLVDFGKPIRPSELRDVYEHDPYEAADRMTATLQVALRRRVVNITHTQFDELVADLEAVYKGEVLVRGNAQIPGGSPFKREQWVSREIPRALDYFFERSPELIWRVAYQLKEYRRKLDRFKLHDELLRREQGDSVPGAATRFVLLGAAGLPFALYGAFWNGFPYKLTGWVARRLTRDMTKFHFVQLTVGVLVYVPYYWGLLYAASALLGAAGTIIFAATLPLTGFYARAYAGRMIRRRELIRLAWLEFRHGYLVQQLRQQRRRIIKEIDAAASLYMRQRTADDGEAPNPGLEA